MFAFWATYDQAVKVDYVIFSVSVSDTLSCRLHQVFPQTQHRDIWRAGLPLCRPCRVLHIDASTHAQRLRNSRHCQGRDCDLPIISSSRRSIEDFVLRCAAVASAVWCAAVASAVYFAVRSSPTCLQANLDAGTSLAVTQQIGSFSKSRRKYWSLLGNHSFREALQHEARIQVC